MRTSAFIASANQTAQDSDGLIGPVDSVFAGSALNRIAALLHFEGVILSACIVTVLVWMPGLAVGQENDHHTVTVVVQPISLLQITVGTVNMNITGSQLIAGQDQFTVTDQSTTILWGTNSSLKKITVNTRLAAPLFVTKVLAVNPTTGTAASESILSTVDRDLILNIGRSSGNSTLRYTGIAFASQGTGKDIHSLTFTIQSQ